MTGSQAIATVQAYLNDKHPDSNATKAVAAPRIPHVWVVEVVPEYKDGTHFVRFLTVYANGEIEPVPFV